MKGKHCSSTSPAPAQLQPSTSPAMVCKHKYQPDTALLSFARLNPTQDSRVGATLLPIIVCLLTARRVMKSAVFLPSLFTIMYLSFGAGADTVSSHLLVQPCAWVLSSGVSLPCLSQSDGGDCDLYAAHCAHFPN